MNGHTPGPWSVSVVKHFYCQDCDDEDSRDPDSGMVPKTHIDAVIPEQPYAKRVVATVHVQEPATEANARLIVAAPELYEALDALTRLVVSHHGPDWDPAVATAREVLSRAAVPSTGESGR